MYVWTIGVNTIQLEFQDETAECDYSLDRSFTPHHLDLVREDTTHLCILEFLDPNTLRITGLDQTDIRPETFPEGDDTLVFKRMR